MPSPRQPSESTTQESGAAGPAVSQAEEDAAQRAALSSPLTYPQSIITVLFLLLALITPAQLHADNIAESNDFKVDTRDYGGSEVAQSGDFTVDTTAESGSGPAESQDFTLDTRAPSPDLAVARSDLFTVDTRAGVPGPLSVLGTLTSTTGALVGGAWIEIKIYGQAWWRGVSGPDGSFYPPEMKAQNYVVTVQKTGYVTLAKNVVGAAGGLRTLPLVITPLGLPPGTEAVNRLPTPAEKSDPGGEVVTHVAGEPEAQLMIYGSRAWHQVGALNSPTVNTNAASVILCHGWKSSPQDWPLPMALLISQYISQYNTLSTPPNILAWDWHDAARVLSTDRAAKQGEALGYALRRRLGYDYGQRVHFIGHSMGTLVNSVACDVAHQRGTKDWGELRWDPALTKPHMTLLDEAELANYRGGAFIVSAFINAKKSDWGGALRDAASMAYEDVTHPLPDWKSPIPSTPASFIDNYISMVGIQRPQVVNVCLTAPSIALLSPDTAHAYAHQWYQNTAQAPFSPVLGFLQSYEGGGTLPTNAFGRTPGSLWYENLATPAQSDLSLDPNPTSFECNLGIISAYAIQSAATIGADPVGSVTAIGNGVQKGYKAVINWVGDKGGDLLIKIQNASVTKTEKMGEGWDAAHDNEIDVTNNLDPSRFIDGISRSMFQIHLGGTSAGTRVRRGGASSAEPGAWLTLKIPSDAAMMQFDFTVNGPPANDCVAAAVAGQNVFNLPLRYVADGAVQSTDMIDISAYAGQTVEFYFGLVGGTSTNCELIIDGLRFVTIPLPPLALENHGATVSLHWPSAASGWTLEASPSLAAGSWQEVLPNPGALTVAEGVIRLEEAKSASRQFYRLRRTQ